MQFLHRLQDETSTSARDISYATFTILKNPKTVQ